MDGSYFQTFPIFFWKIAQFCLTVAKKVAKFQKNVGGNGKNFDNLCFLKNWYIDGTTFKFSQTNLSTPSPPGCTVPTHIVSYCCEQDIIVCVLVGGCAANVG